MALSKVVVEKRTVTPGTCEVGGPQCEDVTGCGDRPPLVGTSCCAEGVPATLHLTVTQTTAPPVYGLLGVSVAVVYDPAGAVWVTGGVRPPPGTTLPAGSTFPRPIPGSDYFVGVFWGCFTGVRFRCQEFAGQVTVWRREANGSYTLAYSLFGGAMGGCHPPGFGDGCSCSPFFCSMGFFDGNAAVITE